MLALHQKLSLHNNACPFGSVQAAALAQHALQPEVQASRVSAHNAKPGHLCEASKSLQPAAIGSLNPVLSHQDSSVCGGKSQSRAVQAAALAQDALQREVEALQVSAHHTSPAQQLRDQHDSTHSGQWQSG